MINNAAQAYGARKVETATPAELTLMLYEGTIKFCNIAMGAIEKKDYEKANINIQKARKIIVELQTTLDHKYPVAEDFDRIYDYIFHKLVQANIKKDPEILEEALVELRDLRDAWKEIMRTAKLPKK
ncbi:flagellar protein FliS [Clostridium sp. CAG:632]|jgi:flagellar protein FliS|nr:flagellar export chaperone FliS [Clostridium sp.]CCY57740.1 flagellar protein FliS [Clostridium sp. CAG:632]